MARGFANLTPEARKAMASLGGRTAHATGMAHQFDSESARKAGAKRWDKHRQAQRDAGKRVPQDDEAHDCLDQLD